MNIQFQTLEIPLDTADSSGVRKGQATVAFATDVQRAVAAIQSFTISYDNHYDVKIVGASVVVQETYGNEVMLSASVQLFDTVNKPNSSSALRVVVIADCE